MGAAVIVAWTFVILFIATAITLGIFIYLWMKGRPKKMDCEDGLVPLNETICTPEKCADRTNKSQCERGNKCTYSDVSETCSNK